MLEAGIVHLIQRIISSPSILVKIGMWRICVDYWVLNKATVSNMFHIPFIEEILDELQRA